MKLCSTIEFIHNEYGGPAVSLPSLLSSLSSNFSVDNLIISGREKGKSSQNEIIDKSKIPVDYFDVSKFNKLRYSKDLDYLLTSKAYDSDVVFVNNLWNYVPYSSFNFATDKNIPIVTSIRGALFPWSLSQGQFRKKVAWEFFQKEMLNKSALIHVTSDEEYKAVRDLNIKSRIMNSSHGISVPPDEMLIAKDKAKSMLGLSLDKRYFIFMSRLHKKKGLDLLLEAWEKISGKFKDWELLIVGPDYGNYCGKFDSARITYLGMLTGVTKEAAFSSSDFFVLPTFSENFGVVIGEALARNLPVLTTTNAPWKEVNSVGCGICFDLSYDNLVNSLNSYLSASEYELYQKGLVGRQYIKDNYSWDKKSSEFYESLLEVI